jgi:hypothetical protein
MSETFTRNSRVEAHERHQRAGRAPEQMEGKAVINRHVATACVTRVARCSRD